MPTRIPLVNGIFSSPAARIVSSRTAGCLVGEPWWATRSGLVDSSIRPWTAVTSRSRARSVASSTPRLVCGSRPRSSAALARPHDVGHEVLEAQRRRGEPRLHGRRLAGQHQQLLDAAARGAVDQPLDLLRLVQVRLVRRERAVLAVAAARPRERERDVARECDPAHPFATIPVCDIPAVLLLVTAARGLRRRAAQRASSATSRSSLGDAAAARTRSGVYLATARGYDDGRRA